VSNGSHSIVACAFVAVGMCLPSRCLAMNVYSDFAIQDFGRDVTLLSRISITWLIVVGSGSDESIYWIFTGQNYN
jgi:hypothetical protein